MRGDAIDHIPTYLVVRPVMKSDGSWRMTRGYYKLTQTATPVAAALSVVSSLLEQINKL